jgi:hypothetical protein
VSLTCTFSALFIILLFRAFAPFREIIFPNYKGTTAIRNTKFAFNSVFIGASVAVFFATETQKGAEKI